MFESLKKQVEYAKNSCSAREALYEAYGAIKMARELGALTKEEFMSLNHMCVADGINNPQYF